MISNKDGRLGLISILPGNIPIAIEVSQEQGVDQRGLPEAALSRHHQGELESFLDTFPVNLNTASGISIPT